MDLDEQLRRSVEKSGLSILQVSKRAGVPYQAIHGFMRDYRDIRLSTAAKIANVVGVELKSIRQRKGR